MVSSKSAVWQVPKFLLWIDITSLQKMKTACKEGAYWGTVAGVYVGIEYGVEKVRKRPRDWKSAVVGGALSGGIVSAATSNNTDTILLHAITGAAVATAANFFTNIK